MKKLLLVMALAAVAYAGWRWQRAPAVESETDRQQVVVNRFWVDHMPQGEKETVRVFALWAPESFGVFADQNHWRVELERFRYEARGEQVRAIFPLSGDREEL